MDVLFQEAEEERLSGPSLHNDRPKLLYDLFIYACIQQTPQF